MNRILFIACFLLVLVDLKGQKWDNTFGTSGNDETFVDIFEGYDKGFLLSGSYKIPSTSSWLIKTDINGNLIWDKVISHNSYEFFSGYIDQNSFGEIVVGRTLVLGSNDNWPSIVKLGPCGNKLWCRTFIDDDFNWGWFNDLILLDNGDVIGLANMQAEGNDDDDIWLYYINSEGDLIWKESYSSITVNPMVMERAGEKLVEFDGEYIITGMCYYPHPSNPGIGYYRPFFIGIDTAFNEKWIIPFGVDDWLVGRAFDVIALNDTTFMGTGFIWNQGDANTILAFFNSDGEELGYSLVSNEDLGQSIEGNSTGSIARMNDTMFIATSNYGSNETGYKMGEFIVDTAGTIYKSESRLNTIGYGKILKTFNDKYIIGGTHYIYNNKDLYLYKINDSLQFDTVYPGTYTYDSLCLYEIESGIIDITDCMLITDVSETPTPEEYFVGLNTIHIKALPNPTNTGSIKLQYSNTEQHSEMELRCFNIHGEEVHSERIFQHQGESLINVDSWPGGMYLAIVYSDNKPVGRVKLVVR